MFDMPKTMYTPSSHCLCGKESLCCTSIRQHRMSMACSRLLQFTRQNKKRRDTHITQRRMYKDIYMHVECRTFLMCIQKGWDGMGQSLYIGQYEIKCYVPPQYAPEQYYLVSYYTAPSMHGAYVLTQYIACSFVYKYTGIKYTGKMHRSSIQKLLEKYLI